MASRKIKEFECLSGNPLDWLWARYGQRASQRALVVVVSLVLPAFLASWLLMLGVQASNYREFLFLWILAHEIFILGFSIDHATDVARRVKQSGMLTEISLTPFSRAEVLFSLARNLSRSMRTPFLLGVGVQCALLFLLQGQLVLQGSLAQLVLFLLLGLLPNGLLVIEFLSLHFMRVCLKNSLHPVMLLPKLLSLPVLSYYLMKGLFTVWIVVLAGVVGHGFLSKVVLWLTLIPLLFYPLLLGMRLRLTLLHSPIEFEEAEKV